MRSLNLAIYNKKLSLIHFHTLTKFAYETLHLYNFVMKIRKDMKLNLGAQYEMTFGQSCVGVQKKWKKFLHRSVRPTLYKEVSRYN